jgi:hypothetical protein
MRYAFLM